MKLDKGGIVRFLGSEQFKKISVFLGAIFFLASFFIAFKPQPFLRFGYAGVFLFNLMGAAGILTFSLVRYMNIWGLALVIGLATAINDSVAWVVGRNSDVFIGRSKKVERIEGTLHKYGPFALFFWSLAPFPYDIVGFIAGYLEFPYWKYIVPTFLGKFVRTILIGYGVISLMGKAT